jgi:hypothetical protein
MPAQFQLEVWRGNTFSQMFRFVTVSNGVTTPVDLTGSTIVFRAAWSAGSINKDLTITSASQGQATLALTVEETRLLPSGASADYEIERRIGGNQTTELFGKLIVAGGINND